jgi:hypothetical protein
MAAKRVAESVADRLDPGAKKKYAGTNPLAFVSELANEIAQEYATDLQRGKELGPLADVVEAVEGPTEKLRQDFKSLKSAGAQVGAALGAAIEGEASKRMLSASSSIDEQIDASRRRVEELRRGPQTAAPAPDPDPPQFLEVEGQVVEASASQEPLVAELATPLEAEEAPLVEVVEVEDMRADADVEAEVLEVLPEVLPSEVLRPGGRTSSSGIVTLDLEEAAVDAEAVEMDAFDVSAVEEEPEFDEERKAALLDSLLLLGEAGLGTFATRMKSLFTPEEARNFELLRAFRQQRSPAEQRAARAKERLLDELAAGLSRK